MEFVLFMIKNDKEINHNLIRRIQNLKTQRKNICISLSRCKQNNLLDSF